MTNTNPALCPNIDELGRCPDHDSYDCLPAPLTGTVSSTADVSWYNIPLAGWAWRGDGPRKARNA
jgi:hypothetical protein